MAAANVSGANLPSAFSFGNDELGTRAHCGILCQKKSRLEIGIMTYAKSTRALCTAHRLAARIATIAEDGLGCGEQGRKVDDGGKELEHVCWIDLRMTATFRSWS